ncbi:leucine carboxyl methyltransferase [Nitzschia inconspicua]|uniref:Leucine carboxyl methyltransferase n=1 Tax=Nitzschia inconspicua TaxID=303405 RepID=A0A9K3KTR7_9STRA|nr:leucine carboxyl methyltransferase [Nitzschia inconspicua]
MNGSSSPSSSIAAITKTAWDAFHAKHSAVMAGYRMVVDHVDIYQTLMDQFCHSKRHRQTPLVHAGYASRVLTMSNAVRSFLSYQQQVGETAISGQRSVQIVLLGCGVDVIGMWAAQSTPELDVTIVEIDMPEVCQLKTEMSIGETMAVNNVTEHLTDTNLTWYSAEILSPTSSNNHLNDSTKKQRYIMIPGNLKDPSMLDMVLHDPVLSLDAQAPTLFLSELVLAYLPAVDTDRLLSWCSDRFSDSTFIALEPLGFEDPNENDGHIKIIGVEEGYRRNYGKKFQQKLEKGLTQQDPAGGHDSLFHPLGTSLDNVTQRLLQSGFGYATATTLGVAATIAAVTANDAMTCPELFDEHAALALHLRSYVLTCGFSRKGSSGDELLRRIVCRWEENYALPQAMAGLPILNMECNTVISEIQVQDESTVREIFSETYQEYMDEHPAIRKMVKGVLNKELKGTATYQHNFDDNPVQTKSFFHRSSIAERYQDTNGIFLVAVKYRLDSNMKTPCRTVIGFVGIQSCQSKTSESGTMEIFRLVVDKQHQGQGIGRKLLEAVERYAVVNYQSSQLVAKTPTILEAASRLYASCGYQVKCQKPLGSTLLYTTFVKKLIEKDEYRLYENISTTTEETLAGEQTGDYSYLGYEEAAPTVQKHRQRRSSLLGHIQAWAEAINQERLEGHGMAARMESRSQPRTSSNRRGSMDAAFTSSPYKRMYHSSDELEGDTNDNEALHDDRRGSSHRRSSLDTMVEQAVAYVNMYPSHIDDDLDPFGSRRDSLF